MTISSGTGNEGGARESQDLPILMIRLAIQERICAFCRNSTKRSIACLRVECRINIDRFVRDHRAGWNTISIRRYASHADGHRLSVVAVFRLSFAYQYRSDSAGYTFGSHFLSIWQ